MHPVRLLVNGQLRRLDLPRHATLLTVLRNDFGLNGPKYGCGRGACGACTVLVDGLPASSCTTLCADVHGRSVTTIEGLAQGGRLDPVQRAFIAHGALQCGFCTPGMILAVKSMLALHPQPSEETIRHVLRGNLCRCTGYVKIIEAIVDLVRNPSRYQEVENP